MRDKAGQFARLVPPCKFKELVEPFSIFVSGTSVGSLHCETASTKTDLLLALCCLRRALWQCSAPKDPISTQSSATGGRKSYQTAMFYTFDDRFCVVHELLRVCVIMLMGKRYSSWLRYVRPTKCRLWKQSDVAEFLQIAVKMSVGFLEDQISVL